MSPKLLRKISLFAITLIIMGVFVFPEPTKAGFFSDLFGSGYDDGTNEQHQGDIELSKRARRVTRDQDYHESIKVRSGELLEVRIVVKNSSSSVANAVVRDEVAGSVAYVPNSLTVNGQTSTGGLTSSGIQINIPAKSSSTIMYQVNVCSASGYVTRASVYAAGIGSGTDGLAIRMENENNYYYNDVSICLNQFQNNTPTYNGNPAFYGGPISDWAGVNNTTPSSSSSNPFAGWTGVNNLNTTTSSNPFAGWTGVNNANGTSANNNPFGDWTGVNNLDGRGGVAANNNPFGDWSGVNNLDGRGGVATNNNPFGDWTGVSSVDSDYDSRGYQSSTSSVDSNRVLAYTSETNFVAPTTGVDKAAPFIFAGLLTAGFVLFKKRRLLFN